MANPRIFGTGTRVRTYFRASPPTGRLLSCEPGPDALIFWFWSPTGGPRNNQYEAAVIERTGGASPGNRRKKSLRRPERGLRDTVLPLYRNALESGRVLPSELRVRTRDGIRLDAENLWSDCSFWFPIFREGS